MSVDLNVYCERSRMPSPLAWAAAIVEAGFEVELDTDFDLDEFTGFLPCKYKGVDSGFEYYSDPLGEEDHSELEMTQPADRAILFVTGSDLRELATSLICAGVLCNAAGGVLDDPQSGERHPAADVLEWVRTEVAECERDI